MDIKTKAVVLNKIKYNDNSYIANILTKEIGKIAVFVRIPKTKKAAAKPSMFYPLNVLEIEINHKLSRNIQSVKHCNTAFLTYNICTDVYKSAIAQFIAEIIGKTSRENQIENDLFEYLLDIISVLDNMNSQSSNLHLLFLKDYARFLGFDMTNNYSELSPYFSLKEGMFLPVYTFDEEALDANLSKILSELLFIDKYKLKDFKIGYGDRKKLLQKLLSYYKMHLADFPEIKSLNVLNTVFTD